MHLLMGMSKERNLSVDFPLFAVCTKKERFACVKHFMCTHFDFTTAFYHFMKY